MCDQRSCHLKNFGWEGDVLKKKITSYNGAKPHDMEVIGVVKDFTSNRSNLKLDR